MKNLRKINEEAETAQPEVVKPSAKPVEDTQPGATTKPGAKPVAKPESDKTTMDLEKVSNMNYMEFVKTLGKLASDEKLKSVISSGLTDGKKEDDIFSFSEVVGIPVRGCKPTQNEVVIENSLSYPLTNKDTDPLKSLLSSKEGSPYTIINKGTPMYIVVFQSKGVNYIIDGHHRWSQVYSLNPDARLSGIIMTSKDEGTSPRDVLKAVQLSILKVVQDHSKIAILPSAAGAGNNDAQNLFKCNEDTLKKYVIDTTVEEVVKVCKEVGKIENESKEDLANYIWSNIKNMREKSLPIEGASSREFMPQTDGAKNLTDANATKALVSGAWKTGLAKGEVNYNTPFIAKKESKKWIKTFEQFRRKK